MDSVKEWAILVCSVSVGSFFTVFLIPEGNLKKPAEIVVSLILLLIVISPVLNNDLPDIDDIEIDFDDLLQEEDIEQDAIDFYSESAEELITSQVDDILSEICNGEYSISVDLSYDGSGTVTLEGITVFIEKKDSNLTGTIKTKVGNHTGIVPQVVIND